MRLFTGLDVPYEMRRNLELLLQLLKPKAKIAWSPLDNLHVTTMFVGEWPDDRLDDLKSALATVPKPGPVKIQVRGLGWFPNPHNPRVFFVSITAPPSLDSLARDTENAVSATGIVAADPAARHGFSPHLTLARIREPQPLFDLKKAIAELPGVDFGSYTAEAFHLYRSELRPGGSIYTKLASYSLIS